MTDTEQQLKLIADALSKIQSELDPTCSPGIASDLSAKISGVIARLEKIEKKLGISQ
ncbi:MAG TPA: hypothetical protein VJN94_08745 [Candidatus Binataceae bacterium]|nr:hypothetical protein [Candidatus Binataceae bacterium]